jgi:hypothetical protein
MANKRDDTPATQANVENTPNPQAEEAKRRSPEQGSADGMRRFEGTVAKYDKDGNEVMSDHVTDGEQLVSETSAEDRAAYAEKVVEAARQREEDERNERSNR